MHIVLSKVLTGIVVWQVSDVILLYIPFILESNLHPFYSFRELKIRCGLESRAD